MRQRKILYFDDEVWFAKSFISEIEDNTGFQVKYAAAPSDFFKEINSDCLYDLFILDIMAPITLFTDDELKNELTDAQVRRLNDGLNVGIVFYEIIRSMDKYIETPIIFHTAKRDLPIQDKKVYYFSKPTSLGAIIKAINKFFK